MVVVYVVGYIAFVDFVGCFPFIGDFIRSYLYFKISKMEVDGEVNVPVHPLAQLKAKIGKCKIPPKIARRNTRGPFLFKCCRVIYNKEKNRLELPRGELVGKTIFRGNEDDEDDEEYKNSAVSLEDGEETNLTGKSIINEYVFKSTPDF